MASTPLPASPRDAARQEMPAPIRHDVRLLGRLLGQVLEEYGGPQLLDDVERLRRLLIDGTGAPLEADEARAEELVASWSRERCEQVAHAFTCYFHLANLAEEHHRVRVLRERELGGRPLPESLAATVAEIRAEQGEESLREQLARLEILPVLTAHPTEARRRAVVSAVGRAGDQLSRLDDPRCSHLERRDAERRLLEEIDVLWRTAPLRSVTVLPQDEVRTIMAIFDKTLFTVVPAIYRCLDDALGPDDSGRRPPLAPAFLRFGTWIGGDRDGNPFVTAQVTAEAMVIQSEHVLRGLEAAARRISGALTADAGTTPPSPEVLDLIAMARTADPAGMSAVDARAPSQPHRQLLAHVADRVRATREGEAPMAYRSPGALLEDLRALQRSLSDADAPRLAYGELQHLIWQVETFGFHLAELEIRQHATVHRAAVRELNEGGASSTATREVLATIRAVAAIQRRFGVEACRRYVVSFTRDASDVAAVYELASHLEAIGECPILDVVPLFETTDDLQRATATLDGVIELEPVRRRLAETGGRLEVMLGYSDSAKEVGPVSATLALHEAQGRLSRWAIDRGIVLTLFHGRGGALGRGGGPANRAVLAQAPGSVNGRFKVTEQGEVILARYSSAVIARRHIEQVSSAVMLASTTGAEGRAADEASRFGPLASRIDAAARHAYRELVGHDGFAEWFRRVTPIAELSNLRIGSRPARRHSGGRLEDLRAIPWVFAWSQTRLNLPGWYGLGSGLAAADLGELRRAYAEWALFTVLVDNADMSLAKTDRRIAARYLALGGRPELEERVMDEYDRTVRLMLAVTGRSRLLENRGVLSWAVPLRNPYVDALSNLQLRALRALRSGPTSEEERGRLERLLLVTVNGVAAGLQNTG
jgi:phosphoenolpyruvate carboxylase